MPVELPPLSQHLPRIDAPQRSHYVPFVRAITNFLEGRKRSIGLSPVALNRRGEYSLRFAYFTPNGMESVASYSRFALARKMFDFRIEKITIRSGVEEEHLLDLCEYIHNPAFNPENFKRPNIEITCLPKVQPKPAPAPEPIRPPITAPEVKLPEPPAGNPFAGKGIEFVYGQCSFYSENEPYKWAQDPDKRQEFAYLIGWLDHLLQNGGQVLRATRFNVEVQEALIKDLTLKRENFARHEEELRVRFPLPQAPAPMASPIPAPIPTPPPPSIPPEELLTQGNALNRQILRGHTKLDSSKITPWIDQAKAAITEYIYEQRVYGQSPKLISRRHVMLNLADRIKAFQRMLGDPVEEFIIP
jgi:hypothetical protein